MNINDLIIYLQKLQTEGKGEFKVQAQTIDYNTANGGQYYIQENKEVYESEIKIDDGNRTITIGEYNEYYSY